MKYFFFVNNDVSYRDIQLNLDNGVATFFGKYLPTLFAICSLCGCLIVRDTTMAAAITKYSEGEL